MAFPVPQHSNTKVVSVGTPIYAIKLTGVANDVGIINKGKQR